jgi:hypothetical protein
VLNEWRRSLLLSLQKRHGQTRIKLNSTITLGSSEDVSFTVELDRTALSRTGVRNGLSRENTEGRSKGRDGQHHHHN